jgi:hypothetical protein
MQDFCSDKEWCSNVTEWNASTYLSYRQERKKETNKRTERKRYRKNTGSKEKNRNEERRRIKKAKDGRRDMERPKSRMR